MNTPFVCPVCRGAFAKKEKSLVCANGHVFDVARQGYVNLLRKKPDTLYEDKALFQARRAVYEAGFFDGMVEAVEKRLREGILLDAGCGEGSLLTRLTASGGRQGIGLDIARDAVQMAAAADKQSAWCVGDLCDIPLGDASVDMIVNVLTPANYGEFVRVLRPEGLLVKVVPGGEHLREIREGAGISPYAHDIGQTVAVFEKQFALREQARIHYQFPCGGNLAEQVFTMTPMTTHAGGWPQGQMPETITVDAVLLAGVRRDCFA